MIGGKARADFQIADDAGIERLGERHAGIPGLLAARSAAGEDQHLLGAFQHRRRLLDQIGRRRGRDRRHEAGDVDRRQLLGDFHLLQFGVEIDVDRPLRCGVGNPGAAQDRLARGAGRGRLVVPFGVFAHQRALIARGVDPVDPGPALDRIDRAGGAEHEHRHAIAPGIEHGHGGVQQPDIGMHGRGHGLAGNFCITVRDGDGGLLMQAEQHLRRGIAEIIDDAVVQPAIARARGERDIGNVERAQRIGDHVAAETRRIGAGRRRGALSPATVGSAALVLARAVADWDGVMAGISLSLGFGGRLGRIQPDHEPLRNRVRSHGITVGPHNARLIRDAVRHGLGALSGGPLIERSVFRARGFRRSRCGIFAGDDRRCTYVVQCWAVVVWPALSFGSLSIFSESSIDCLASSVEISRFRQLSHRRPAGPLSVGRGRRGCEHRIVDDLAACADEAFVGGDQGHIGIDEDPAVARRHLRIEVQMIGGAARRAAVIGDGAEHFALDDFAAADHAGGIEH